MNTEKIHAQPWFDASERPVAPRPRFFTTSCIQYGFLTECRLKWRKPGCNYSKATETTNAVFQRAEVPTAVDSWRLGGLVYQSPLLSTVHNYCRYRRSSTTKRSWIKCCTKPPSRSTKRSVDRVSFPLSKRCAQTWHMKARPVVHTVDVIVSPGRCPI